LIVIYAVSRLLACSIVFLPVIYQHKNFQLHIIAAMTIVSNIIFNVYRVGMNVWVVSLLEPEIKGSFMYLWEGSIRVAFTFITVIMGFIMDAFGKRYMGFLIVFITALVLAIADIILLNNIYEPEYLVKDSTTNENIKLFEPLTNNKYRRFLLFTVLYSLVLHMSSSYTNVFLLKYLNLGYGFISIINIIKVIFMLASSRYWLKIGRKNNCFWQV
jgi:hypothetical protein